MQAETAAAVSITVGDDLEAFEHGDDVLASHALAGDGAVSLSLADNGFFLLRFFGMLVFACLILVALAAWTGWWWTM